MAVLALACAPSPSPDSAGSPGSPGSQSDQLDSAVVDQVIDGDTLDLTIGGVTERVRLIGIDTPESVAPSVPVQCYGAEASQALADLLPVGTEVRIERDAEARDRYGRLLLYVHRADDDLFVNRWLVESGYADSVSYEPNTTFQADFNAAKQTAQASGTGLWSHCDGPDQPLE